MKGTDYRDKPQSHFIQEVIEISQTSFPPTVEIMGIVTLIFIQNDKSAFFEIQDTTGAVRCKVFANNAYMTQIEKGSTVQLIGKYKWSEYDKASVIYVSTMLTEVDPNQELAFYLLLLKNRIVEARNKNASMNNALQKSPEIMEDSILINQDDELTHVNQKNSVPTIDKGTKDITKEIPKPAVIDSEQILDLNSIYNHILDQLYLLCENDSSGDKTISISFDSLISTFPGNNLLKSSIVTASKHLIRVSIIEALDGESLQIRSSLIQDLCDTISGWAFDKLNAGVQKVQLEDISAKLSEILSKNDVFIIPSKSFTLNIIKDCVEQCVLMVCDKGGYSIIF